MANDYSFDIVSKLNMDEVKNAINQATKEVQARFDFKGKNPIIELREKSIFLKVDNSMQMQSMVGIVELKLSRREVSLKFFKYGEEEKAAKGAVKRELTFKEGIDKEEAKRLVELIKKNKLKVKTQIQEQQLKVSGRDKDELQKVIQLAKDNEEAFPFQFVNYR
ncbi:MAG: YajQ family cyclic di-GMP-binding protein [bacterium]